MIKTVVELFEIELFDHLTVYLKNVDPVWDHEKIIRNTV